MVTVRLDLEAPEQCTCLVASAAMADMRWQDGQSGQESTDCIVCVVLFVGGLLAWPTDRCSNKDASKGESKTPDPRATDRQRDRQRQKPTHHPPQMQLQQQCDVCVWLFLCLFPCGVVCLCVLCVCCVLCVLCVFGYFNDRCVHTLPCRTHIFLTHFPCVASRHRVHAWLKVFAVRMSHLSISPSPFSCFPNTIYFCLSISQ